jgi:hypothetical protein
LKRRKEKEKKKKKKKNCRGQYTARILRNNEVINRIHSTLAISRTHLLLGNWSLSELEVLFEGPVWFSSSSSFFFFSLPFSPSSVRAWLVAAD